jgi:hypothetical protein
LLLAIGNAICNTYTEQNILGDKAELFSGKFIKNHLCNSATERAVLHKSLVKFLHVPVLLAH